jgi:hypothetical protein
LINEVLLLPITITVIFWFVVGTKKKRNKGSRSKSNSSPYTTEQDPKKEKDEGTKMYGEKFSKTKVI